MIGYLALFKEFYFLFKNLLGAFKRTPEEKRADFLKNLQLAFNMEKILSGDTSTIEDIINKDL